MTGAIYSVGYEGLDADALAAQLAASGVTVLVDVRLNAVSRRRGFSKKALAAAMTSAGIEYVHERELGNPQDNRDAFRKGDVAEGRERMRAILSHGGGSALDRLVDRARTARVAVMCVERDHTHCHREVITDMVHERDPSIGIVQMV